MNKIYAKYIKRLLDIVFSFAALIMLSPVLLVVALLVRICLGSPVLFRQERPGQIDPNTGKERIFKLYKFRSMSDKRNENGELLPDKMRLNKFGRILRSTSLDELPELFNILNGDMSFVGPRPLLVKYLAHYNSFEVRRHEVRPGLTGLAQVNGRVALPWKRKFEMDVEYVDNFTFLIDLRIIFQTIKKVIAREGITYKKGNVIITNYFKLHGSDRAGEDKQE